MIVQEILTQMKADLSSGALGRNGKLPVREVLGRHYGVSKATVQKAFAALEKEGFVVSRGSMGTFVNPTSPNRNDVAVILPTGSRELTSNSFYGQFPRECSRLEKLCNKRFRLFYVDDMRMRKDDFQRLGEEARAMRFWGAFFTFAPFEWMYEPFLENGIPVVALTDESCPRISTVWVDYSELLENMLRSCQAAGCRRPALISMTSVPYRHIVDYKQKAMEMGMEVSDRLIYGLHGLSSNPEWFKHPVHSFFSGDKQPDALLLLDETFLLHSYAALLEIGKVPGKDVQVISQRTFPGGFSAPEAVSFIGFGLDDIVQSCLRALAALSDGKAPTEKFELIPSTEPTEK